jgi:serine protease Do
VDVGEWVAATGLPGQPVLAVGIVSTPRRKIIAKPGFLGVALADPPAADNPDEAPKGVLIKEVTKGSAAEAAGLLKDDIILRINGKEAADRSALSDMIHSYEPNTDIMLTISRAGKEREMKATLGSMTEPVTPLSPEAQAEAILKGSISARASNFPAVIQHDTVIFPKQCGGPLVDLNGNFLGINIARAGRTESYAIPADLIKPILAKVTAGPATQPGREISAPAQK